MSLYKSFSNLGCKVNTNKIENFEVSLDSNKKMSIIKNPKNKIVCIKVFSENCGACIRAKPLYSELSEEYNHKGCVMLKQSKDFYENKMNEPTLQGYPTFHIYLNGYYHDQVIGADIPSLKNKLDNLLLSTQTVENYTGETQKSYINTNTCKSSCIETLLNSFTINQLNTMLKNIEVQEQKDMIKREDCNDNCLKSMYHIEKNEMLLRYLLSEKNKQENLKNTKEKFSIKNNKQQQPNKQLQKQLQQLQKQLQQQLLQQQQQQQQPPQQRQQQQQQQRQQQQPQLEQQQLLLQQHQQLLQQRQLDEQQRQQRQQRQQQQQQQQPPQQRQQQKEQEQEKQKKLEDEANKNISNHYGKLCSDVEYNSEKRGLLCLKARSDDSENLSANIKNCKQSRDITACNKYNNIINNLSPNSPYYTGVLLTYPPGSNRTTWEKTRTSI